MAETLFVKLVEKNIMLEIKRNLKLFGKPIFHETYKKSRNNVRIIREEQWRKNKERPRSEFLFS